MVSVINEKGELNEKCGVFAVSTGTYLLHHHSACVNMGFA
jgi:hypothetical protein